MRRREPGPADRRCDTRWQSVALALALAAGCLTCSSYAVDAVAPDTLAIDLGHADAAYAARQWQEAFQAYQRIADSYPSLAVAVFRLGKCAAKLGLSARATDAFHHAATLSPTDPLVRGELADALRIEKRIDEAEYQYHRAIEIAGADAHPAWSVGLGLVAMARGSLSDAERHFSKALRLAPDAAAIHYNLGEVSLRQNQIDDARHAYEAAIEHDEAFPIAHCDYSALPRDRWSRVLTRALPILAHRHVRNGAASLSLVERALEWVGRCSVSGFTPLQLVSFYERSRAPHFLRLPVDPYGYCVCDG